jgi:PAS domain S-box-containing protein
MSWHPLAYVVPLLVSVVSSLVLGAIVWQYREYRHARTLLVLLLATVLWAVTYVVAFSVTDVATKQLVYALSFSAIGTVSITWFLFAVQYTGRFRALTTREIGLLSAIPLLTTVAGLTNRHHHLVWAATDTVSLGQLDILTTEYGPLFWVFSVASYLLLLAGTVFIFETAILSEETHRSKAVGLILAAALPLTMNVLYLVGMTGPLDLTPSAFSLSGAILIGAVFRDRLLQSMPLAREMARDRIINEMSSAVIVLADQDRVVDLNPAAEALSAASRSDIVGSGLQTVLPAVAESDAVGDTPCSHAHVTRTEHGSTRHYEVESVPVDRGHRTDSWQLLTVRDVTEHRQRERRIERERDKVTAVFDATPYPLVHVDLTDAEPTVLRVNDTFEATFGYEETDIVGDSLDDYIVPDGADESASSINEQGQQGVPVEREVTRSTATGETREFLFKSALLTHDDVTEGIGVYVDVTDRNRRVEMLEQLKKNITDVVWMSDDNSDSIAESEIEFVSDSYEDVWGRSTESLRADRRSFLRAVHEDDRERVQAALTDQAENPDEYEERYRVVTPDGEVRWVHDRSAGVYENGELNRIIGVATDITERRRRSNELEQERRFIDQALDTMTDIFYVIDTDGSIRRWNDRFSEVTGLSDAELDGRHAITLFPEAEQERLSRALDTVLTDGTVTLETNLLTSNGDAVPYEFTGALLTDGDGNPTGIVGIGRDISEQKQREQQLRQYKTILEVLGHPVYAIDSEGYYTYVNDAFVDHTGYERTEAVGDHVSKVLSDAELERGREVVRELLSSDRRSTTWEMKRMSADDDQVPTENHTALLPEGEDGAFRGTAGVIRDISERKQRTRQLETFQEAVENAGRMIYWMDPDGVVEYVNPTFEAVTGYEAAELVGNRETPLLSNAESDELAEDMLDTLAGGEEWECEFVASLPARDRRVIKQTVAPVRSGGDVIRFVVVAVDITTERNREQQLSVLQRVLRHDLRNNLNEILLSAQLAQRNAEKEDVQQCLEGATRTIDEILSLIENVRRVRETFEEQTTRDRAVDIAATTRAQVESLRTQRPEAEFSVDLSGNVSVVTNDLLKEVIRNVLMNAIQHNDTETPEIDVHLQRRGDEVELSIADNGPGIPETVVEILDSDRETQLEHLDGFGLWLVNWVVSLSGGTVEFASNDPRGSVVKLLLPVADAEEAD